MSSFHPAHRHNHATVKRGLREASEGVATTLQELGLSVNTAKTEYQIFDRSRKPDISPLTTPWGDIALKTIKWLGILLDSKLSWTEHVRHTTKKAGKTLGFLQRVNQCYCGLPPRAAVTAVKATIITAATYGAAIWADKSNKTLAKPIDNLIHAALRTALPVWKTAPLAALHRETGTGPTHLILQELRRSHVTRAQRVAQNPHPLRGRTSNMTTTNTTPMHTACAQWWEEHRPSKYAKIAWHKPTRKRRLLWELDIPRKTLHLLLAERSGHGDFTLYHQRFNHDDPERTCPVGCNVHRYHLRTCIASRSLHIPGPHHTINNAAEANRIGELYGLAVARQRVTQKVVNSGRRPLFHRSSMRNIFGVQSPNQSPRDAESARMRGGHLQRHGIHMSLLA